MSRTYSIIPDGFITRYADVISMSRKNRVDYRRVVEYMMTITKPGSGIGPLEQRWLREFLDEQGNAAELKTIVTVQFTRKQINEAIGKDAVETGLPYLIEHGLVSRVHSGISKITQEGLNHGHGSLYVLEPVWFIESAEGSEIGGKTPTGKGGRRFGKEGSEIPGKGVGDTGKRGRRFGEKGSEIHDVSAGRENASINYPSNYPSNNPLYYYPEALDGGAIQDAPSRALCPRCGQPVEPQSDTHYFCCKCKMAIANMYVRFDKGGQSDGGGGTE